MISSLKEKDEAYRIAKQKEYDNRVTEDINLAVHEMMVDFKKGEMVLMLPCGITYTVYHEQTAEYIHIHPKDEILRLYNERKELYIKLHGDPYEYSCPHMYKLKNPHF